MSGGSDTRIVKYGVAASCLILYAGISAWIVAGEGENYRKDIARRTVATGPWPEASTTAEVAESPEPEPVKESAPAIARKPDPEPEPSPPPPASRPPPPVVKPEPKPSTVATAEPAARPPDPSTPAPEVAKAPALDPFWSLPAQQKKWDLDHLKTEDERQLGGALHEMVRHFHPRLETGPLPKRVSDAGELYLKSVARKDVEYTFTVLDCPHLNAFSHPGGYVYVCKGLFNEIGEDEDHALEFILAHEMAHVDLAHAIVDLKDPEVKKMFDIGTVPLFYGVPIPGGYLENQEYEADRWAAERMIKMGRSRYQILAFLRVLEIYAKLNGFENYRKNPGDPPYVPLFDNHIRTHPVPSKRLKRLSTFIDTLQKP